MRRFEFVGGGSSKFWMPRLDGSVFTVVYGRIGTDGQRKEKEFDSEEAAQKEYDKKVAEKLREGYVEVTDGAGATDNDDHDNDDDDGDDEAVAKKPAKKPAAKEPAKPAAKPVIPLPVRVVDADITDTALVKAATTAVRALVKSTAGRSWRRRQAAKEAFRALSRIAGVDLSAHADLNTVVLAAADAVLSAPSLPLPLVLQVLSSLRTSAFSSVLARWQKPSGAASSALQVLAATAAALPDQELAFRVGRVLVDKDLPDVVALKQLQALRGHIESRTDRAAFVAALPAGDVVADRRKRALS
jgi:predicted DNA-binding WGR domain protein